jgi:hypothetical protein
MSFLKGLFGGNKTGQGPHLPPLLKNPDRVDFKVLFSRTSPETLVRLCHEVPVDQLVLYPDRSASRPNKLMSDSMADLLTACFRLASVITQREADPQYADIFIPRLIKQIEAHDPQTIIPLAWEPIRDLALDLIRGKRNREALRCLSYVKRTILGSSWTDKDHGGAFWIFAAHANIGWSSKKREEIQSALDLVGTLKGTELQEMSQLIDGLKTRLAAL